ncbi:o-succinylbenzoate synthase [Thermofilum pendens]|uniref:o-succinylbenzoate synthase n=1 Tax=Thermofilum pendens (strain DSM 2475 / Hrk 5) TaxID=368408 RepID=A1RWU3_THEPD|nr:o-succinylbenzoate synthase [Thermofilum pendens]ABL77673.1 Mandelate racemase/muconate lactonizing enzyme, N-terminal domain protein [Thermofilum pendens Hrk 5]
MEIRKLELFYLEMKLKEEFRTSFGSVSTRPVVLVRVEEKGGEEGWGELVADRGPWYSYETYETSSLVIRKFIAPSLVGRDIEEVEDFHRLVASIRGYPMAKTAVEEALLDLEARMEGRSVSEVLGGSRQEIEAGVSIGIKASVEELLREVRRRLEEGYQRIKVKIKPGYDVEVVKRIREEFGDIRLQVDANGAYSLRDIGVFRELDRFNLLMLEQPLAYDDLYEHSVLSRKISTPVCLDESIRSLHDLVVASILGSAEVVNVKPARVGGVLKAKSILEVAAKLGWGAWVGGMLETGIGRAFLVALASLPFVNYPNDISASNRYWDEDIVEPPWEITPRGTIAVPRRRGLGVEVKRELVDRLSLERWTATY